MTNPDAVSLRFDAGRFESQLLLAILAVQATVLLMISIGAVAFVYLTIGDFVEPRPLFSHVWLLPYLVGGAMVAGGLGRLYE